MSNHSCFAHLCLHITSVDVLRHWHINDNWRNAMELRRLATIEINFQLPTWCFFVGSVEEIKVIFELFLLEKNVKFVFILGYTPLIVYF